MAQIPGSVPLTGKVAPTDTTDTFATHVDIYGEGGYMTVADQTEREAITTERRKQGMAVFQNDTNEMYILQDGVTNADWVLFSGGGGSQDLQSVVDNGGSYTGANNVDIVVQNSAISPRYCRIRGGLTGNVARTLVSAKGEASDSSIEVILDASENIAFGPNKSRIELQGATGNIEIKGTGMGTPAVGSILSARSVTLDQAEMEWQPGIQQLKVNLSEALIQTLHTTGYDLILSGGIPSNKFLNVLNIMCYVDTEFTNSETLRFYIDGCSAGGGFSNPIYQADLITGKPVGTGTYASRSNSPESFGSGCQALTTRLTGASGVPVNSGGVGGIDVYVTYQFIDK